MKKLIYILAVAASLASGCKDTQTYTCADGSRVRLTAVTDDIFRVEAVPQGADFSSKASLCVVPQGKPAKTSVSKSGNVVSIMTAKIQARLDLSSGAVSFFDLDGNAIAAEDHREFSPIEVEGTKAWTVRQVFAEGPEDEGFYGLGQHQADEWNYRGRNEELYQYNTKISVPFIVSNKGYGILWDSYSFCRWGDPRDYAQLGEVFKLYDANGEEGALTGTYTPFRGEKLVRRETALAQEFLRTPECDIVRNSPEGFNFGGSYVEYNGWLEPAESGVFRFYLYYAGYTKVFIGGEQVMPEIWRTAWNPNGRKFECTLEAGKKVPVHIEWKPDGGVSYCGLRVLSPVDSSEQNKMSWWGEMQDEIDYYFIAGANADKVISGYRTLTGKAPIPPKWAMGFWQSFERYHSQDEVLAALKGFRDRNIPCDNIVQDWQYWKDDQWGSHEFDETRYPDPKGMVDSVHAMGGRFMISVWPKFYKGTEHFDEMDAKGWIYRTAIDEHVIDWLGYEQSFYDAYSDGARKLFWKQMYDHLYPIGVDSWWMDASEPNIHDCTDMDYRKKMCGPTALGPSAQYFNAYALMNAQAIYEGQRSVDNRRVFLLTRNGFAGLQRYSTASWSGDIGTRWEDMKAQLSAGLNYAMSGIPIWGQDVGGFSVENRYAMAQSIFNATGKVTEDLKEWRELNVRWHEWGMFTPLYRAHGQFPNREPWNIAPEGSKEYETIVACLRARYNMMPYIYSMAASLYFDDYTMMRPLVMDFPTDPVACNISDEYMFGDVLVCPVFEYGARSRKVYLPEGCAWFGHDADGNSARFEGGQTIIVPAPLESIPTFYREGAILLGGEDVDSTAENQDKITVNVFAGADGNFKYYTDNGTDYSYETGEYARVKISWDDAAQTLTFGACEGKPALIGNDCEFFIVVIGKDGSQMRASVKYTGKEEIINIK